MRILPGKKAGNFKEATVLAFQEAGVGDMSPDVADLFLSAIDANRLKREADNDINSSIHGRYGRSARWEGKQWFIPVLRLRYDALPIPQLAINVQACVVALVEVETTGYFYSVTLVGAVGKPQTLILPMSWLLALLDNELERFDVTSADGSHTGWNIPGFKEALRLPNEFTTKLVAVLRLKSIRRWLQDFGRQGESVAPLIVGSLLGLQFHGVTEPLPVGQQTWKREIVLDTLTQMFGTARAGEMFGAAAPYLEANMTNEAVIRLIFKEAGRRGIRNGT